MYVCMYVCMYMFVYGTHMFLLRPHNNVCMHICMYVFIYVCKHNLEGLRDMHTYERTYTLIYIYELTHITNEHTYIHTYIHVCMRITLLARFLTSSSFSAERSQCSGQIRDMRYVYTTLSLRCSPKLATVRSHPDFSRW